MIVVVKSYIKIIYVAGSVFERSDFGGYALVELVVVCQFEKVNLRCRVKGNPNDRCF